MSENPLLDITLIYDFMKQLITVSSALIVAIITLTEKVIQSSKREEFASKPFLFLLISIISGLAFLAFYALWAFSQISWPSIPFTITFWVSIGSFALAIFFLFYNFKKYIGNSDQKQKSRR
jgi:hypothetical protein